MFFIKHRNAQPDSEKVSPKNAASVRVAIVGGGSAGLLAAGALASLVGSVTVFEKRCKVRWKSSARTARNMTGYALLAGGIEALNDISPQIVDRMLALGARLGDSTSDVVFAEGAARSPRVKSGLCTLTASKHVIEDAIREWTSSIPGILLVEATVRRAEWKDGVWQLDTAGEESPVEFDFIVDATGRRNLSDTRDFLPSKRKAIPLVHSYNLNLLIVSCLASSAGDNGSGQLVLRNSPPPAGRFGTQLMKLQGDLVQAAVAQRFDFPDRWSEEALLETASLAEETFDVITGSLIRTKFSSAYWRRDEVKRTRCGPFIRIGDALISTNPVFGMGISTAAIAAHTLQQAILKASEERFCVRRAIREFDRRVTPRLELAWQVSSWTDKCYIERKETSLVWWNFQRVIRPIRGRLISDPQFCHSLMAAANLKSKWPFAVTLLGAAAAALRSCRQMKPSQELDRLQKIEGAR